MKKVCFSSGFVEPGRDLYVFCANASDGILTAHPSLKGEHLQDIKGKKGFPLGQEIMRTATAAGCSHSNVRFWHLADVPLELTNVCFEGKERTCA